MVNCRFVSEITSVCNSFKSNIQELERLSSQQSARRDQKKKQTVENCAEHNLPLGYYCETCCEALCSDCAMFESKHQQHKFKKIGEVYDKHIETIKQETTLLEKRLDELNFLVSSVDENISRVQKAKEERSVELKKAYNEMQEKLASELEKKLDTLSSMLFVFVLISRSKNGYF
jgi:tripartite motif-containing protein 37